SCMQRCEGGVPCHPPDPCTHLQQDRTACGLRQDSAAVTVFRRANENFLGDGVLRSGRVIGRRHMRLFASALYLDPPALKALAVTDAYSLHRVVYSLYEDVRDEESKLASKPSGILYADHGGDARGRRILMLADRPPADAVNG